MMRIRNLQMIPAIMGLATLPMLSSAQDSPALVEVDEVRTMVSDQTSDVTGRLVAKRRGRVAVRIDGSIVRVPVAIGDRVTRGQTLAELDKNLLRALHALAQAEQQGASALLKTAEAEVDLAKQEVARLQRLQRTAAASRADYDDARQKQTIEETEVEEARVEIKRRTIDTAIAKARIDYANVYAPYDGIITEKFKEIGDYAKRGDALFSLVGDTEIEIEANIFSSLVVNLNRASKVTATTVEGVEISAVVRAILPVENDRTRTRTVRFSIQSEQDTSTLTPGQGVVLHLPSGPFLKFLSVHKDAVIYQQGKAIVYIAKDGTAQSRQPELSSMNGNRFEVTDGLGEGDLAIVRGNERMRPGQSIQIKDNSD